MSQQQQPQPQTQQQQQQQQQRVGGFKVKKTKRRSGASQTSQRSVPRPGTGLAAILAGGRASSAEVQDLMFQLS